MPYPLSMTEEVRKWLKSKGFHNHCFISYPRARYGKSSTEFAERVRENILEELEQAGVTEPIIYIDKTIAPGVEWPQDLQDNLSCSVSMIAILSELYFTVDHPWCGREWAAMETLGKLRHPNLPAKPIIPVLYRGIKLPDNLGRLEYVDLSRISISGRRYYSTKEFRRSIGEITQQIIQIATNLYQAGFSVIPIEFPEGSPFGGPGSSNPSRQPPPLRTA